MGEILPGILETDFLEIEKKLAIIKPFSRKVHIDFLDGKFSPNATLMDPQPFRKYAADFFLEAHLMVDEPTQYLDSFASAGFKRFLGHVEKMKDREEFLAQGQILGEVGLALDIDTNYQDLKIPFDDLDCLLVMSVKAGKSGQNFLPQVLEKIKALRTETQIPIEIDGGIDVQTIIEAKNAGAVRFVSTSYIFKNADPMAAYERMVALA